MNKNVYDYFKDLEKSRLDKDHNAILSSSNEIVYPSKFIQVAGATFDDTPCIIKGWKGVQSIHSLSAPQLYNGIGILTPPVTLVRTPDTRVDDPITRLHTAQQDITSVKDLVATIGSEIYDKHAIDFPPTIMDKWEILYDRSIQEVFLQFMTPECLEEFIGLYLVDELLTEKDRHSGNYFFVKSPNAEKYEAIVAIDNSYVSILNIKNVTNIVDNPLGGKWGFKEFLKSFYSSATPLDTTDFYSYNSRMRELRDLLFYDKLTAKQIALLRSTIKSDYPKAILKTCKYYHLPEFSMHTSQPFQYLWEYNRNTLGRDLGM